MNIYQWIIEIPQAGGEYGFYSTGGNDSKIYWGDGTETDADNAMLLTHQYSSPGIYFLYFEQDIGGPSSTAHLYIRLGGVNGQFVKEIIQFARVGAFAFANCSSLKSVPEINAMTKNETLDSLFSGCSALENVKISVPETVSEDAIYTGCSSLKKVEIYSPIQFASNSFNGCTALKEINFYSNVTLADNIFTPCSALKKIYSLTSLILPDGACENCTALEMIQCMPQLTVKSNACCNCNSLKEIYTSSIIIAGAGVFSGCHSLEKIYSNEMILNGNGQYYDIFRENKNLQGLPDVRITDISLNINFNNAFRGCEKLTYLPISLPIGAYTSATMVNMYTGCISMQGSVDLDLFQNRTDVINLSGYDCFTACFNLENYTAISEDWGGGYVISGEKSFEISGKTNEILTLQLDTTLEYQGNTLPIEYNGEKLPKGFFVSADGIISGITSEIIIGEYNIPVLFEQYIIKNITVNFRIANISDIKVDIGTIGYKLGNKFIKIEA